MKAFSLPKSIILKTNADFRHVFANGKRIKTRFFYAVYLSGHELKVGFAASGDVAHKPERNTIKRYLRELWRLHFRDFNLKAAIVLMAKPNILNLSFAELESDFRKLLTGLQEASSQPSKDGELPC